VAAGMQGMPVTIRTFDLGADKQQSDLEGLARVSSNPALGLRDVSPGGFAIVSRQSFAVIIAQLHFTVPTGEIFSVEAEAVHCQLERVDPEIQFLSGWRFTGRNTPAVIQALIAAVTMPTDASET